MADDKEGISRRDAIKNISVGMGVVATLPVLGQAQDHSHHHAARAVVDDAPKPLKFFSAQENKTIVEMTERIIPADESSPGAKAAGVNEYLDLVISASPEDLQKHWREGLAAVNKKSQEMFGKDFADSTVEQQVALLTEISKNERSPRTIEERFFRTIKNGTIDGYYTSKIGIHQELKYKGNSYLKEFPGCTHPEHQK